MRHWGIAVLLVCGAALRVAATVAYWPGLVYIDTPRYLSHSASGVDPLGYHYLLLKPLLILDRNVPQAMAAVTVIQHLLGLALGVGIYALLVRHRAPRWLAALAAAPVLLDAYQLQFEQMIMPDLLFEALIGAAVLLLAWPAASGTRARTGLRVAGAALVLGLAVTVRQVGELAVIPLLVYAIVATAGGVKARARTALVALFVFAVPVLGYMTLSETVLGTGFRLSSMNDAQLYARVADAADCATLRLPADERALCPPSPSPGVDNLANEWGTPYFTYKPPPGVKKGTEVSRFDRAVLTQQPLRVAARVAQDGAKVFALTRDTSPGDTPVDRWQFKTSYPVFNPADSTVFGPHNLPYVHHRLAVALRWYQLHGGFTPGPLLLACVVLALAGVFSPRVPRPLRVGTAIAAGLALAVVGGADLYEFSWRYQLPALVTLPPAGALGALAVLRRAARPGRDETGTGTMNPWTRTRQALSLRSGRSAAASSTQIPGSGSEETISSAETDPAVPTPSSSETTSP